MKVIRLREDQALLAKYSLMEDVNRLRVLMDTTTTAGLWRYTDIERVRIENRILGINQIINIINDEMSRGSIQ